MGLFDRIKSIVTPVSKQITKPAAKSGAKSAAKPKASKQPIKMVNNRKDANKGLKVQCCQSDTTRVTAKPKISPIATSVGNPFAKLFATAAEVAGLKKPNLKQNPKAQITHKGKKVTIVEVHNESKDNKGKKVSGYVVAKDESGQAVKINTHACLSDPKIHGVKDDSGKVVYFASYGKPHEAHVLDDNETKNHRKREARAISNLGEKDGGKFKFKGENAKKAVSHIHDPEMAKAVSEDIALKQKTISPDHKPKKGFTHLEEALHDQGIETANNIKTLRDNGAFGPKFQLDENGKPKIDPKTGKKVENPEYAQAVGRNAGRILVDAAKGTGTKNDVLEAGLKLIDGEGVMEHVNKHIVDEGYQQWTKIDGTDKFSASPLENLLLSENDHDVVQEQIKTLFDQGAYGEQYLSDENGEIKKDANGRPIENQYFTKAMARNGCREIEHELSNTPTTIDGLNRAMGIVNNSPGARLAVEELIKLKHPDLKPDMGSYTRALIKEDGFGSMEVDRFDAVWVANKSYAPAYYDENGKYFPGDQDHRNMVIDNLCFGLPASEDDKYFREYFRVGLGAIDAPPMESADYQHFLSKCKEQIDKNPNAYNPPEFKGQDYTQQYMQKWFSAEGMDANNNLLFKGVIPARVQAESSLRAMRTGDYSHTFDSMDPEAYKQMTLMLQAGEVKGISNLKQCYDKAIASAPGEFAIARIQGNALISNQIKFSDSEAADICFKLMELSGRAKGQTIGTLYMGTWENASEYCDHQIKTILESRYDIIDGVAERLERHRNKMAQMVYYADGQMNGFYKKFSAMLDEARGNAVIVAKDQVFLDAKGRPITDKDEIKRIMEEHAGDVAAVRQQMLLLEREYNKYMHDEGGFAVGANWLSRSLLRGADRGDVELAYRKAKTYLRKLEAAAQGRLRDANGNVVSYQQLVESYMKDIAPAYANINDKYKSSQKFAKGALIAAPAIAVAQIPTGGGVLFSATMSFNTAFALSYAAEKFDMLTSETGNNSIREQNAQFDALKSGLVAGGLAGASRGLSIIKPIHEYQAVQAEYDALIAQVSPDPKRVRLLSEYLTENQFTYGQMMFGVNKTLLEKATYNKTVMLAEKAEKAVNYYEKGSNYADYVEDFRDYIDKDDIDKMHNAYEKIQHLRRA